jgi:predicted RNA binding protein YcfA (HicA-like mRNA interferase family)
VRTAHWRSVHLLWVAPIDHRVGNAHILAHCRGGVVLPRPVLETNRGKVVTRLELEGWVVRHGGDHDVYKHPSKPGRIVVARHRTLSVGVARVIAKTAGWVD